MEAQAHHAFSRRDYAMKKHHATRLHYDLRLEWNGVLLSWAILEGPSFCPSEFREAIEMEDHRRANLLFEGLHETGPIMLWDFGTWEPHPEFTDVDGSLRNGLLRFMLYGERLRGTWTLSRTGTQRNTGRPIWTLCKGADEFAEGPANECILKKWPNSITGKTMEEIVQSWTQPRKKHEGQQGLFDI